MRAAGFVVECRLERPGLYRYTLRSCPESPAAAPKAEPEPTPLFESPTAPASFYDWDDEAA